MIAHTTVEILNSSLSKIAEVKNLYPLNRAGDVLRYSKELSNYGRCTFRISTKDPFFTASGDIIKPHSYHIRVKRNNVVVWQGAIVDNPHRNKNFVEVQAYEYLYYLDKVLVKRLQELSTGEGFNYRIFSSGTMSDAIVTILGEMKTAFGSSHIMSGLVVSAGNIDNPNYPNNFVTGAGLPLTGAWSFSSDVQLQFDYQSVLFVIKNFAIYGICDFKVDNSLTFYFRTFLGNKQQNITFTYGSGISAQTNIVDYDLPRTGTRMANDIFGLASDANGKILYVEKRDEASIQTYGLLQSAVAYADVKNANTLTVRTSEQLFFVKDPDTAPLHLTLNEKSYPLGQYDIGDIVSVRIKDHIIDYFAPRRIVKITVNLHETGRELTTLETNRPRDINLGG